MCSDFARFKLVRGAKISSTCAERYDLELVDIRRIRENYTNYGLIGVFFVVKNLSLNNHGLILIIRQERMGIFCRVKFM